MKDRDIYVVAAVRTAIGSFGGSLKDVPASQLAVSVVREALRRSNADAAQVAHVVMGNVIPTEPRDAYLSRVAAIEAGLPQQACALNVNRLCGSGLQAVVSAAQALMLGDAEVAVGGGAESMSRSPYLLPTARWGARMGDAQMADYMLGILHDPFHRIHMGMTAEAVAQSEGITRDMQDALAVESHRRAARAVSEGRFREQIVPIDVPARKGTVVFDTYEHVRADLSMDQLAKM